MWTRPADRAPSYGPCGQGLDKCCALAHPLPTLGALAPTSSPLLQRRFIRKATAPAPTTSRIASSSQAIRLRNKPANCRGDPTRESEKQQVVKRKTAKDRFSRALRGIGQWCREHRHWKLREQQVALSRKLQGHYAYYGITGNFQALNRFRFEVERLWCKWLGRRSWRGRMTWDRFACLRNTYPLPAARVVHSVYR